ncbi:hypothetical protein [Streptosporangium amethystogenes]|nr:hypothetical protein [Streptosporangium amethystogenes]
MRRPHVFAVLLPAAGLVTLAPGGREFRVQFRRHALAVGVHLGELPK